MNPLWIGLAIVALALIAVFASVGRVRRFLQLRNEVETRLEDLAKVVAPAEAGSKAVLDEAKAVFNELGTRMSGFARYGVARLSMRGMGFDPASASRGLIGFSNALPTYGIERLRWRGQIERALKIESANADARKRRSRLDPLLLVVALAALAFAAWVYKTNWDLHHDLKSALAARAALTSDIQETRTGAAQVEQAKLAVEQSLAQVRAELAAARKTQSAAERALDDIAAQLNEARKAKAAADQSVEATKQQLGAAESARRAAEDRSKALAEEMAALTAAKDAAERSLKEAEQGLEYANEQLAKLKSAKEASDAAATKAATELANERKAREAADKTPPSPPSPTP